MHSFLKYSLLLAFFGSSCTLPPPCCPPQMDIPFEWHSKTSEGMHSEATDCFLWWKSLNDPALNSLMERAAFQNLDLAIAGTRILEARAAARVKEADCLPHASFNCDFDECNSCCSPILSNSNCFEGCFDAGRKIGQFEARKCEICASQNPRIEALYDSFDQAWVTLSAELARNYVELRALQLRMKVIHSTIEAQKESQQLTEDLLGIGMSNTIDAAQAEAQSSTLAAERPLIQLAIQRTIHRISILLGQAPGELYAELSIPQVLPRPPRDMPIGIPSNLLRRRPDIRLAESRLMQGDCNCNKAKTKQAIFEYQKTVLEALEETENALASFHAELERNDYLLHAQDSAQKSYDAISDLYKNGFKGYMDALAAQRTLFTAKNAYIQSQLDLLTHYIALYKSLGGGWYGCCTD